MADALEEAEAVVGGEGVEEVLEGGAVAAGLLDELGDDGGLVLGAQGRGGEDVVELGVTVDNGTEVGQGLGGRLEGRALSGSSVLNTNRISYRHRFIPTSYVVSEQPNSEDSERYTCFDG